MAIRNILSMIRIMTGRIIMVSIIMIIIITIIITIRWMSLIPLLCAAVLLQMAVTMTVIAMKNSVVTRPLIPLTIGVDFVVVILVVVRMVITILARFGIPCWLESSGKCHRLLGSRGLLTKSFFLLDFSHQVL